jgi:hypothetical protein
MLASGALQQSSEFDTMEKEYPRHMIIEPGSIHAGRRVYILANKSESDHKWKNIFHMICEMQRWVNV